MLVKQTNDQIREYDISSSFCGVGFRAIQLTHKDFTRLFESPDPMAILEQLYSRMAFPNE
jgi:hypothetical protein